MPHHEQIKLSGTIGDIFAHRFVLKTKDGNVLADIGPRGAEIFTLRSGDKVEVEGEQKPSEIKVQTIQREGEEPVAVDHPKPRHEDDHPHKPFADPKIALKAAEKAGFDIIGEPHRKPKHFELRVRDAKGHELELHIELDGQIRKEKRIERA